MLYIFLHFIFKACVVIDSFSSCVGNQGAGVPSWLHLENPGGKWNQALHVQCPSWLNSTSLGLHEREQYAASLGQIKHFSAPTALKNGRVKKKKRGGKKKIWRNLQEAGSNSFAFLQAWLICRCLSWFFLWLVTASIVLLFLSFRKSMSKDSVACTVPLGETSWARSRWQLQEVRQEG